MISNNEPGTTTAPGLHDFLFESVLPKYLVRGEKILDLGSGPGSLTARLLRAGWDVTAADAILPELSVGTRFVYSDFNRENFARELGPGRFGLVISVEVIEHVENPIG